METVPHDPSEELEAAWRDEVLRRVDEVRRGDVEPEPWSEVKKRIREKLGQ